MVRSYHLIHIWLGRLKNIIGLVSLFLVLESCSSDREEALFRIRRGQDVGIHFQNRITTNDSLNAITFEYIYNGGGVGVGDFDLDGLPDLFFGGNQTSSRLYINSGKFSFRDVTKASGVVTDKWITGVSVVDINLDGLPDIYLSVGGEVSPERRQNLLFIHQGIVDGIPRFRECAADYGLADEGYGTMAAFFDYDLDGDLDVYVVNNWLEKFNRNNLRPKRIAGEAPSTDQLYRNNGDNSFTNVSREAGILIEGYGLGIVICDINQDFWPDIYVSNDFMSNDLLWINQRNGTFRNQIGDYLKHQTHNGMGVDIADFNNDGLSDIITVDMLPPDHARQKLMIPGQNYDHFHMSLEMGYQPQYMRNTLQLNRGRMDDGRVLFSEIGFLAGVAQTDWSWAPLFADLDNDGWKDLFISNGYRKDVTNLDFIFFHMEGSPFGTERSRRQKYIEGYNNLLDVKITNNVFRNTGSLTFEDKTPAWGMEAPSFSNGAAYADLDNDGDLDLITNNIDQEVILYENLADTRRPDHHFIQLECTDAGSFQQKVTLYVGGKMQYIESTPYRGYQSTVENKLHFGVGKHQRIDSVVVVWPDSTAITYRDLQVDTLIQFSKEDARKLIKAKPLLPKLHFVERTSVEYNHTEKSPSDMKSIRTLLHELTRYGPCLAIGDVDSNGREDFLVGGEGGDPTTLFIQKDGGRFETVYFPTSHDEEDGAAVFFDADGDGDVDLYIAKAAHSGQARAKSHQLFLNDGAGKFTDQRNHLPEIFTSASCVKVADFNNDGRPDLFVGGRIEPGAYPNPPRSYLLKNLGGRFADVTPQLSPELVEPGMVSSAVWTDIDSDKLPDLIIAGEWMPIRIFKNTGSGFEEATQAYGLENTNGWWNCLHAADLDNDGFPDLIAGNTGENSFFKPSVSHPVQLVSRDFDGNGSIDPIVTYYNSFDKDRFIVHNRMVLIDQIPGVKRRFETFDQYARASFDRSFTQQELKGSMEHSAFTLSSVLLKNNQGKTFQMSRLPEIAQISSLNDIVTDDLNQDGFLDIIAIGNMYAQETIFGRYDASIGTILLGDGRMNWQSVPAHESNFVVDGDVRNATLLTIGGKKSIIVTQNNGPLRIYEVRRQVNEGYVARVRHRLLQ